MKWLIWPPLASVLFSYPLLLHEGYVGTTALTVSGTLLVVWALTCGVAALVHPRSRNLALALALLWLPASVLALLVVSVATFDASGL